MSRTHSPFAQFSLPFVGEQRIHEAYSRTYELIRVEYVVKDAKNFGRIAYNGSHQDSRNLLRRLVGKPEVPVADPDVATFLSRVHDAPHLGRIDVNRNSFRLYPEREVFLAWDEIAHEVRDPLTELLLKKFPEYTEINFVEMPISFAGDVAEALHGDQSVA